MNINDIKILIESVGFPIVCVVALGWFIYISYQKITEQNEKRENKLYTVISEAQEQNNKLSDTNAQFVSILNTYKSDLDVIKSDVNEIKDTIEKCKGEK